MSCVIAGVCCAQMPFVMADWPVSEIGLLLTAHAAYLMRYSPRIMTDKALLIAYAPLSMAYKPPTMNYKALLMAYRPL